MSNVIQFNKETTSERLWLDEDSAVINLSEGFCFRYRIPKHERQLVATFGGLSNSDNFESIVSWVRRQIIKSDAMNEVDLRDEVENKFRSKIEQFY